MVSLISDAVSPAVICAHTRLSHAVSGSVWNRAMAGFPIALDRWPLAMIATRRSAGCASTISTMAAPRS